MAKGRDPFVTPAGMVVLLPVVHEFAGDLLKKFVS
jgi:hypothetical protein